MYRIEGRHGQALSWALRTQQSEVPAIRCSQLIWGGGQDIGCPGEEDRRKRGPRTRFKGTPALKAE